MHKGRSHLLFIVPEHDASAEPIIDSATRRMTAALRHAVPEDLTYMGFHTCICGAGSESHDFWIQTDDHKTKINSLCVHYLAFHREEVPIDQLAYAQAFQFEEVEPTDHELHGRFLSKSENERIKKQMLADVPSESWMRRLISAIKRV